MGAEKETPMRATTGRQRGAGLIRKASIPSGLAKLSVEALEPEQSKPIL